VFEKKISAEILLIALQYVWKSSKKFTSLHVILVVLQSFPPIISIYLIKLLIDILTQAINDRELLSYQNEVIILTGGMALVLLISIMLKYYQELVSQSLQHLVGDYLVNKVHQQSLELDLSFYDNHAFYDALHKAQGDATYRPLRILNSFSLLIQNTLTLCGLTILLFSFHWVMGLLLLITTLPSLLLGFKFSRINYNLENKKANLERKSWYYSSLLTSPEYAKEIRSFDLGKFFKDRFSVLRRSLFLTQSGIYKKRIRYAFFVKAAETVGLFGTYTFIAIRALSRTISVGDFVMYFQAFQKGQQHLQSLLKELANIYESRMFLKNLVEFLALEPVIKNEQDPLPFPKIIDQGIAFNHVNFRYRNSKELVLEDLNASFEKGKTTALVGANGAGKSTITKLISRLYDPGSGTITLNNQDIRKYELKELRKKVRTMPQDFVQYFLTVEENIKLGHINKTEYDFTEIMKAAQKSSANHFIEELPEQYDTMLGNFFKDGVELSVGQWQKLALSRIFYGDPEIIILDEPSSNLDPISEYQFFKSLKTFAKGKILIIVSHRLATIAEVDRILVMNHGKIVEEGTHVELISRDGVYSKLFGPQINQIELVS